MDSNIPDIPESFGSYEVKQEISRGRTRLYLAYDRNFGIEVVIKVLPKDFFEDQDFFTRFKQDLQILAAANLPGILPIYDLGFYQEYPYLVERYLPGGTLADRIANGPMDLDEVVRIVQKVSKALDSAHRRGVLHLNLKPQNIIFDSDGEPYLSDFGMVKISANIGYQVLNFIDGAPAYVSPEQALGQFNLDNRSDIYSLGALVYEMLSGQKPFKSERLVEQAAAHVTTLAPDLLKLRPDLPSGCAAAIDWAMCKDPDQRYQSATEFAVVFSQQADPEVYMEYETRRLNRRLRIALLTALVLILSGVASSFYFGWVDAEQARNNVLAFVMPSSTPTITLTMTTTPTPVTPTETNTPLPVTAISILTPTPPTPTDTPTITLTPSNTPVPTVSGPIIGFANRIAVINDNEIYVMRLDGTDLEQLTADREPKDDLQWTPDGKALIYYSKGNYIMLSYPGRKKTILGKFSDFALSIDQKRVVVGDKIIAPNKNWEWWNFIGPFDLLLQGFLKEVSIEATMGGCPFVGGRRTRFSADGETLAAIFPSPSEDGRLRDVVQLFSLRSVGKVLMLFDIFPANRFKLKGYLGKDDDPKLYDFGWDGVNTFAVHGNVTRTKFGEMVIYTRTQNNATSVTLAPVDNRCCYQDIQWSPDGNYLLFVYQNSETLTDTQVYYELFATIGEKIPRTPLPFPEGFFKNPDARVEPALRPALP